MAELTYNYTDSLQGNAYTQFIADQHDQAVQMSGRRTYVFLLDKEETKLSDVYNEETNGRLYLPWFEQRGIYKSNTFVTQLSARHLTETEENLEIEYDFGRMVANIRALKDNGAGTLIIRNTSEVRLEYELGPDKFTIRNYRKIMYETPLDNKIYRFIDKVNSEQHLTELSYAGDNEELPATDRIYVKLLPRRKQEIKLNNSLYRNASDVISQGAVIVTDRYRLYQVVGAYPRNDIYGRYVNWNVQCELMNLAKANLPGDFDEFIKKNQYGLGKYDLR